MDVAAPLLTTLAVIFAVLSSLLFVSGLASRRGRGTASFVVFLVLLASSPLWGSWLFVRLSQPDAATSEVGAPAFWGAMILAAAFARIGGLFAVIVGAAYFAIPGTRLRKFTVSTAIFIALSVTGGVYYRGIWVEREQFADASLAEMRAVERFVERDAMVRREIGGDVRANFAGSLTHPAEGIVSMYGSIMRSPQWPYRYRLLVRPRDGGRKSGWVLVDVERGRGAASFDIVCFFSSDDPAPRRPTEQCQLAASVP